MSKFVLTAQLQLQAPGNTRQVINQLRSQLQGQLNIPVSVTGSVQATKQIKQVTQQTQQATTAAHNMGKAFGASIKRFAAFNIATRAVGLLASKLSQAVDEAIEFQRQLVKISQVTGKTVNQLQDLTDTITRFATTLGVSSTALLGTTRILAQAGIQAGDLKIALEALAKTTLAPTFDNITQTAEGAVAILAQFGQGVGALEQQLGAINAVAGQFAVESGDLISSVRRMGGVFRQAGGDLNELLALFTSVRATTRENAESISTGLRTIFTRIQRPQTIEYLKKFGVELVDLEGKFIGPYEAVRELSKALAGLDRGDIRFVEIAEQLGGFRQIGKVIPLLQQFEVAERARQAAVEGGNSLNKDAITAQQALAVQIEKTREKFLALIRSISETSTFHIMIKSLLGIANAFIKVAEAIKPIIPLIAAFGAFKLAKGIGGFASGLGAGLKGKNQGGKIHAFASGGTVPGTGNRDTVPAMLTPGEFVIRKSSVNKIGAGTLAAMNENGYAAGGVVSTGRNFYGSIKPPTKEILNTIRQQGAGAGGGVRSQIANVKGKREAGASESSLKGSFATRTAEEKKAGAKRGKANPASFTVGFDVNPNAIGGFILKPAKGTDGGYNSGAYNFVLPNKGPAGGLIKSIAAKSGVPVGEAAKLAGVNAKIMPTVYPEYYPGVVDGRRDLNKNPVYKSIANRSAKKGLKEGLNHAVGITSRSKVLDFPPAFQTDENLIQKSAQALLTDKIAVSTIEGFIFEGMIGALTGAVASGGQSSFDFGNASIRTGKGKLKSLFGNDPRMNALVKAEAKRSRGEFAKPSGVPRKLANEISAGNFQGVKVRKLASGGGISGSDTVPAMLTPGEFVVNKKASQSIGYGNLNKMNKQGVVGKNQGGKIQAFASGGPVPGTGNRDTVPAMLTPGEFVIRKSSVSKIGAGTLATMNENGYAKGGPVSKNIQKVGKNSVAVQKLIYRDKKRVKKNRGVNFKLDGKEQNQFTVNDTVNSNITKREIAINQGVLHRMPLVKQKQLLNSKSPSVQGIAFEDYLRESKRITSPAPRFSGNEALDGKKGKELIEVKRTGVADVKLLDKLLRDQLSHGNKLNSQTLSGGPEGDTINLPPLTELSLNKASLSGLKAKDPKKKKNSDTPAVNRKIATPRPSFFGGPIGRYATGGVVSFSNGGRLETKGDTSIPWNFGPVDKIPKAPKVSPGAVGVFDSDYIGGGRKDKSSILASILQKGSVAAAIWGPAGSGKSTLARSRYGSNLVRSLEDVDKYDSFAVLSGSGATKKGSKVGKAATRFSAEAAKSFAAAAKIIAVLPNNLDLANRRRKRINSNIPLGDKRSKKQLIGTKQSPGTDYSLAAELKRFRKPVEIIGGGSGSKRSKKMAKGGPAGTDTVPAMLTPGEFVINKKASQSIGYGNLNKMNKQGVVGFASGGPVEVQHFASGSDGTGVKPSGGGDGGMMKMFALQTVVTLATSSLSNMTKEADGSSTATSRMIDSFGGLVTTLATVAFALQAFGVQLSMQGVGGMLSGLGGKAKGALSSTRGWLGKLPGGKMGVPGASKLGKSRFGKEFGVGRGMAKYGDQVTGSHKSIGRSLGRGVGKVGNLGKTIGGNLKSALGPALALGLAFKGVTSIIDAYSDHQGKLNKAIEEGNAAKAEEHAANNAGADAANNIGMGLIAAGAAFGPWGAAAGAAAAVALKLAESFGLIDSDSLVQFMTIFGGDTLDSIKASAKASALAGKYNKELAGNSKAAAEQLKKVASGAKSMTEAFASGELTANLENAQRAEKAAREASDKNEENKTGALGSVGRNILTVGGLFGETSGTKNARIDKENEARNKEAKARTQKEFEALQPQVNQQAKERLIQSGGNESFDDFFATLPKKLQEQFQAEGRGKLEESYENQRKAIQENIKYLQSLDFGLRDVNAVAAATSASMERMVASQETGFNAFGQAADILEQSMSSAAIAMDPKEVKASQKALADTLRSFGANENQVAKATGSMDGFYKAQLSANDALGELKANIKTGTSSEELKTQFSSNLDEKLKDQGVDEKTRSRIQDTLGGFEFTEEIQKQIAAGDFSGVMAALEPLGEEMKEQVLGPMREKAKQDDILIKLTRERIQLEQRANQAKKKAIDIEMEAAQAIADFGGRQVTSEDKKSAINRKLDIDLSAAGIGSVGGGSTNELAAAQQNISGNFNVLQQKSNLAAADGKGAFAGPKGVEDDKRPQLEAAQQSLITATRARIALVKEEMDIIKRKNELEKSSLDKLLSGDIEGFFEGQAATGAASALRTGNQALIGSFSASSVGRGFQDLQGQNLPAQQMERIASGTLGSLGVQDRRSAQVLSGNTAEEQAKRAEGQQLAGILGAAGAGAAEMAEMAVDAKLVVIKTQGLKLEEARTAAGMASGGVVGKNQGGKIQAFASGGSVPGTGNRDTVPAMLTPGEFVIRKSSVSKIGADTLAAMNENGYAGGGEIQKRRARKKAVRDKIKQRKVDEKEARSEAIKEGSKKKIDDLLANAAKRNKDGTYGKKSRRDLGLSYAHTPAGIRRSTKFYDDEKTRSRIQDTLGGGESQNQPSVQQPELKRTFSQAPKPLPTKYQEKSKIAYTSRSGEEGLISAAKNEARKKEMMTSYYKGQGKDADGKWLKLAETAPEGQLSEKQMNSGSVDLLSSLSKFLKKLKELGKFDFDNFATGGGVSGPGTVPAMLTPGEFVVNKKASQSIGYGNLNKMNKQGVAYANRGIFVPRGTDTVPAMLTPGEFVVNRASVQRGNNLAVLQAMNNNQQSSGPAMNRGGSVRYYGNGSDGGVQPGGGGVGISAETVTSLNNMFSTFSTAVDKLSKLNIGVKLDPTEVNVNFNNTSFLATLHSVVASEVLAQVKNQIPNIGINMAGGADLNASVLKT